MVVVAKIEESRAVEAAPNGLPRLITKDVLWTGGCLDLMFKGEVVHSHFNNYIIRGKNKILMIDTGHPIHRPEIEKALDSFLEGRSVDYIFPTHPELPHCGLLPTWLDRFPEAKVVGSLKDYRLYYPAYESRFVDLKIGDTVDLGDRRVIILPAIWGDLANTCWAFDTGDRVLFVSDAYALIHAHKPGHCGLMTGEHETPDQEHLQMLNKLTLQWMPFHDVSKSYAELDTLLAAVEPRFIAPAHGAVVDEPGKMTALLQDALAKTFMSTVLKPGV
ncbi:flavorubredoxin [Neorhizobium galegae]|uniref:MBL fold metallo-hydrolase n=1 Tax=Neorhizobium galegae TaxID=399 RepID=UPI0027896B89|nr:MBL fold metallo-hydrolase [Neorhizobium galegae]MDQ0137769.1 flavorubredoxin [Neorhizobium galegae]